MEYTRTLSICVFVAAGLFVCFQEFGLIGVEGGLVCPKVPEDQSGACVELCTSDTECQQAGEKCCSNGCGHACVAADEAPTSSVKIANSGLFPIDDVFIILIGMGCVVFLLVLVIIITLCFYGKKNSDK